MIHEVKQDSGVVVYCISAYEAWRPGSFESVHAARMGQRLSDEQIEKLQAAANSRGDCIITEIDIRAMKCQLKTSTN